jgi:hypothetical protein
VSWSTLRSSRWILVATVGIAIGLSLAAPQAAMAECDGPAVSFRDRAGEAPLVVVGDVSSSDPNATERDDLGRTSRFSLRVLYVLRGEASGSHLVEDLPAGPCSSRILARPGDRIALALGLTDKLLFGDKSWGAVAWIRGTPLEYEGIERTTVADAFRVLGLQPPDTSMSRPPNQGVPFGALMALIALSTATAATVGLARRFRLR